MVSSQQPGFKILVVTIDKFAFHAETLKDKPRRSFDVTAEFSGVIVGKEMHLKGKMNFPPTKMKAIRDVMKVVTKVLFNF